MWGFQRTKPKPRPAMPPGDTLEGISDRLQNWLNRMHDLVDARRSARATEIAAIDEKMDELCREASEDVERTHDSAMSKRLQRMKRLTLEEILEMRDNARQERRVDG